MLTFPSAASGGYRCAILEEVVQSVRKAGFQTTEKNRITPEDLLEAEELFLFDSCNGIQKVLGLEDQRYFSTSTALIATKLAELAIKDREERIEIKNEK
jgi:branched-subunit amino acid aminotransferase/4-amino-4-deoxychorismate lyase